MHPVRVCARTGLDEQKAANGLLPTANTYPSAAAPCPTVCGGTFRKAGANNERRGASSSSSNLRRTPRLRQQPCLGTELVGHTSSSIRQRRTAALCVPRHSGSGRSGSLRRQSSDCLLSTRSCGLPRGQRLCNAGPAAWYFPLLSLCLHPLLGLCNSTNEGRRQDDARLFHRGFSYRFFFCLGLVTKTGSVRTRLLMLDFVSACG